MVLSFSCAGEDARCGGGEAQCADQCDLQEPPAQEKLRTIGFDVMIKNEVEAADYFKSEVASWGKMTRAIGYSSD